MTIGQKIEVITTPYSGLMPGDVGIMETIYPDGYAVKINCRTQNPFGGKAMTEDRIVFFKLDEIKEHEHHST